MVYYRKYRPQTIDELDSSSLRETLNSVFVSNFKEDKKKQQYVLQNGVPHAFMFTGPKGLGKTSTARIVSKVINCLEIKIKDKSVILCDNHCDPCKTIAKGTNMDVLEIDGASNRGIDEVRDLREKVRLSPVSNHKKVYIIDEVHMLTTEAFNALLKTIEEPPSHVVFIFCTTEAHKVPATIFSRCFNVPFMVATANELCRSFERIVKGEKLSVEEGVLSLIATMSDGSFRDGAKILEELALLSGGKQISTRIVEEKYHISSISQHVASLVAAFAEKDAKAAIQLVSQLSEQGVDIKYFLQQVLNELHKLVLINVGIRTSDGTTKLSLTDIQMLVTLLSKAYTETKFAAVEELPLEIAIITFTSAFVKHDLPRSNPVQVLPDQTHGKEHVLTKPAVQPAQLEEKIIVTDNQQKVDKLMDLLINKTKVINQSLAGVLRSCYIKEYDGKTLVIEARYPFHKQRLDDARAKAILQKVTEEIAGKSVSVSILLKE